MNLDQQQDSLQLCNQLQTHKGSFQAWKCVSFGCSLLSIVLLLSKWHEVTTDLHLLLGIERLLTNQLEPNGTALSWPPIPLEMLLPQANEASFGIKSIESNDSMLMSHMHISLSRQVEGEQLLRQEVAIFIAEFRNAKSTLGLSSLLVSVYILSWILMTLAINDTRISNDVSLRNILLLSVFGAIDIAASVGFVMVRLIMYSVKNNSFTSEMLQSSGIRDSPVRLSADQLTAFTALRLIGMRSCSSHVDIYVSVIVSLLTVLRLYAILRALTYYRRLRYVTDRRHQQNQLNLGLKPTDWSVGGHFEQTNQQQLFSTGRLVSQSPHPRSDMMQQPVEYQQQVARLMSPTTRLSRLNYTPGHNMNMSESNGQAQQQKTFKSRPISQQATTSRRQQMSDLDKQRLINCTPSCKSPHLTLHPRRYTRQKGTSLPVIFNEHCEQEEPSSLLVLNRQAHKVTEETNGRVNLHRVDLSGGRRSNFEESLNEPVESSSQQNLLDVDKSRAKMNTIKANGTSYTLLSAAQLDKLSRKLLAAGSTTAKKSTNSSNTRQQYKLIARYKQMPEEETRLDIMNTPNSSGRLASKSNDSAMVCDSSSSTSASCSQIGDSDPDISELRKGNKRTKLIGIRQTEEIIADDELDRERGLLLEKGNLSNVATNELTAGNFLLNKYSIGNSGQSLEECALCIGQRQEMDHLTLRSPVALLAEGDSKGEGEGEGEERSSTCCCWPERNTHLEVLYSTSSSFYEPRVALGANSFHHEPTNDNVTPKLKPRGYQPPVDLSTGGGVELDNYGRGGNFVARSFSDDEDEDNNNATTAVETFGSLDKNGDEYLEAHSAGYECDLSETSGQKEKSYLTRGYHSSG